MAEENVSVLIVGKDRQGCFELVDRLKPEIVCAGVDVVSSTADAFQLHIQNPYRLCFVYEGFEKDLPTFFGDIRALGRLETCGFILVTKVVSYGDLEEQYRSLGFAVSISSRPSTDEKKLIGNLFEAERRVKDVKQKCVDVSEAVKIVLREIDNTAKQRKRGRFKTIDKVLKNYLEQNASFDASILEKYMDALCNESESSIPFKPVYMAISEVWKKKLPEMTDDGYVGVSNRTWERLRKRWGNERK